MTAVVNVEGLIKRYGSIEAVRGISLTVHPGEIVGLLGPNGSGKTTTLECIIGLRRADGGSIQVCGIDVRRDASAMREKIGVQLQATALPEQIRVSEALKLFASFYQRAVPVADLIERFSLQEKADAAFHTLSGGQKQRLAMALAVINEPQVLFLDEPTAAMDPQARRELHRVIQDMRANGRSVFITTHHIDEAELLCDRVAIVDHGQIIALDTPAQLVGQAKAMSRIVCTTNKALDKSALMALSGASEVEMTGMTVTLNSAAINKTVIALVHYLDAVETATNHKAKVILRFELAKKILGDLQN
jgi:ABC-2 type transport system ATP-binding protein